MNFASTALRTTRSGMIGLSVLVALTASNSSYADAPASCRYIKLASLKSRVVCDKPAEMYFCYLGGPVFGPYEESTRVSENKAP